MKITVKNKEFDSGKLVRSKYTKYLKVKEELTDKEAYTDEDLDKMVSTLVLLYDNQFTEDDINEDFEISDIIINFMSAEVEIAQKVDKKVNQLSKLFTMDKK